MTIPAKPSKKAIAQSLNVVKALASTTELKFTFADAERLTAASASWPLPVFPGGPGKAARDAIEASERERKRVQGIKE